MEHLEQFRIPEEAVSRMNDTGFLMKELALGKTLQEIIGYTDAQMEDFYQVAVRVFREGRYDDAEGIFTFLSTLNPNVYAFWLGLGMCYQLKEEYEQALLVYTCASDVDLAMPLPDYYRAGCFSLLQDTTKAIHSLESALLKCGDKGEFRDLKAKTQLVLNRLKEK